MTNPLTGSLAPNAAIPKALDCSNTGLTFPVEGHLFTTYKIAMLAGIDIQVALVIAYFSQYPDIDPEFNAVNQFPKVFTKRRNFVMRKLHSLHGGNSTDIHARKDNLRKSIKQLLSNEEYWKAGILIHSLGDAYAHTKGKFNSIEEKAYGPKLGHGVDSAIEMIFGIDKDPDNINRSVVREKYIAYVNDLFSLLKNGNANEQGLNDFLENIKVDQCADKICPTFQVLSKSDEAIVDRFIKCMNESMRSLRKNEVESLFINI